MGTREAGGASCLPGYRQFERAGGPRRDRGALERCRWSGSRRARGLAYPDIIEAALDRRIRALWIIGTNPIVSFPNLGVLQQALEGLDFLVVQDGFHPTPTSELAHLVLPAAVWGEKEGTYTNSERRVSKVNRCRRAARRRALRLRHLSRSGGSARRSRRALPRLVHAARCLRRVEACVRGTTLRLLGDDLRSHRATRRHSVAVSAGRERPGAATPSLHRRTLPDRRRAGAADSGVVGAVPRATVDAASLWC